MEHKHFQTKNQIRNVLELDLSVKGNKSSQTQLPSKWGCKPGTHGEKKGCLYCSRKLDQGLFHNCIKQIQYNILHSEKFRDIIGEVIDWSQYTAVL